MNRTVLIISGHVQEPASKIDQKGAQSYTGIFEHEFNDAVVGYFEDKFHQISGIRYDVIKASRNLRLRERVEYANRIMPDLYLEIHHDAAQTEDIEMARQAGEDSPLWKDMGGFSVHYSENNYFPERSFLMGALPLHPSYIITMVIDVGWVERSETQQIPNIK